MWVSSNASSHVRVNACAFVKPTFVLRGIGPDNQHVIRSETQEIGYIVGHSDVAAFVVTEVKTIDPELRIAVKTPSNCT